jgi:hypothetical protein
MQWESCIRPAKAAEAAAAAALLLAAALAAANEARTVKEFAGSTAQTCQEDHSSTLHSSSSSKQCRTLTHIEERSHTVATGAAPCIACSTSTAG